MTGPVIQIRDLRKEFHVYRRQPGVLGSLRTLFSTRRDTVHAVDGISFEVGPGELIGLIGANGAGKSTTIKMLCGILHPSSGEARVFNRDPCRWRKQNASRIGVVFGHRTQLMWDLPLVESFNVLRWIYGIPSERFERNMAELGEILGLGPILNSPVRNLSLGQRVRGDLAASLLHDPELVFLDEPTIALDVHARDQILDFVRYLNEERGRTILLTTHDLINLERTCERILVIDRGRLLFDGPKGKLKDLFGAVREVVAQYETEVEAGTFAPPVTVLADEGHVVRLQFNSDSTSLDDVLRQLSARGKIVDLSISAPTIESVAKKLISEEAG